MGKDKNMDIGLAIVAVLLVGGSFYVLVNRDKATTSTTQFVSKTSDQKVKLQGNKLVQAVLNKVKAEVPTIKLTRVYTEATDPNNDLGKNHNYQYAGSFYDTRTDYKPTDDTSNPIPIEEDNYAASAGGAIEIFATDDDAKARGIYLDNFQTGMLDAGAYRVVRNVVLRASEQYTASMQQNILDIMQSAL